MEANRNSGGNLVVKAVAALVMVVVAGLGGWLLPTTVEAQSPNATRSFSAATVAAGGELEVTVTPSGYGRFGQVVETLPEGFSFISRSLPSVKMEGRDVVLTFLEGETLSYMVTASTTSGVGSFSGILKDEDKAEHRVGGQHQVTVLAALDLLARYDTDGDNAIERLEYLAALDDFIDGLIDKAALLEVLDYLIDYLSGSG